MLCYCPVRALHLWFYLPMVQEQKNIVDIVYLFVVTHLQAMLESGVCELAHFSLHLLSPAGCIHP